MREIISFLLLFGNITGIAQTLPVERSVDWSLAGHQGAFMEPSTIIDFSLVGGIGNGITINDSAMSAVLGSLNGDSAIVYIPNGTYFFTQPINLVENVIIRGESSAGTTLLFDLVIPDDLITLEGGPTGDIAILVADVKKDSVSIELNDVTAFQIGDYVEITEDDSVLVTSVWALGTTGQVIQIDSISGNLLFLASPLRRDFTTAKNARLVKLDLKKNSGIESLKVERLDSTSQQTSNINFEYTSNCWVKCIESVNCNFAHIEVRKSTNLEISGSYLHHAFSYGNGGKGYGVMLQFASGECLVTENIFDSLRHAMILQAGANGNVFAYNYSKSSFWTGVGLLPANSAGDMVLHGNYPYANLFEGNIAQHIVIDNSHGRNGKYNTFFRNRAELYGLFMSSSEPSDSQNYMGNEITNSGSLMGNYLLAGTGHFEYGNNQLGTIIPTGTDSLPESSLFLEAMPPYYMDNSSWPPIGPPNSLDTYTNEAMDRLGLGEVTKCAEAPIIPGLPREAIILSLQVYPNPTADVITLELVKQLEPVSVSIFDLTGRVVKKISSYGQEKLVIDLSGITPGVYLVEISGGEARSIVKVVKY